jgi:ferrochelatase
MRYGNPSIRQALASFAQEGVNSLTVFPLYPQYSLSATESSRQAVQKCNRDLDTRMELRFVPPFYDNPAFINVFAKQIQATLEAHPSWDHVLLSFHGLPESHMSKLDRTRAHCFKSPHCCNEIVSANRNCYRAQCFATARLLTARLGLSESQYTVSFQSRLGRAAWIRPYTDEVVVELARKGVRRLVVSCPAFVADCLETLEEIRIRERENFIRAGGSDLVLVPSLNDSDEWARVVHEIACANL